MSLDNNKKLELFRMMLLIRLFEEALEEMFSRGILHGTMHLSIGQEATATGACLALTKEDLITSTHRGHGHCLAKGADRGIFINNENIDTDPLSIAKLFSEHLKEESFDLIFSGFKFLAFKITCSIILFSLTLCSTFGISDFIIIIYLSIWMNTIICHSINTKLHC